MLPKNMPMDQLTHLVGHTLRIKLTGATSAEIRALNNNLTEKVNRRRNFCWVGQRAEWEIYSDRIWEKKFFQAQDQRGEKNEAIRELLKNVDIYNLTTRISSSQQN